MNKSKLALVAGSAVLALNLLGTSASAEEVSTTNTPSPTATNVVSTVGEVKTISVDTDEILKLKTGDKQTYKFTVTKERNFYATVAIDELGLDENTNAADYYSVAIKDSKGTIVSTEKAYDYQGVHMVVASGKLPVGNYTIEVEGLTPIGEEAISTGFALTADNVKAVSKITKVATDKTGVLPTGVKTKVTATASDKNVLYTFEVYSPSTKKYKVVKDSITNNKYNFKQTKAGTYKVRVTAVNEAGETSTKTKTIKVVKAVKPTKLKTKVSAKTIKAGKKVTVTNSAKGNNIEYQVSYRLSKAKASVKDTVAKKYTATKKVTFKAPIKKGTYKVIVTAKQHNGTKTVKVTKTLKVN